MADGKILIGGDFTMVGATGRNRVARLNADGSLDPNFLNGLAGANGVVNTVAVQSDGKILIGGDFTTVNGTARVRIAGLHADGSTVNSIVLQPDGKILMGGNFTTVNLASRNRIARLNANSSLDTGFNPGVSGGAAPVVNSIALQVDNNGVLQGMLLGGEFTTVASQTCNRVARLNPDGSLDSFNPGTGPNGSVRSVAVQVDGRVVLAGNFTAVPAFNRSYIARLNADGNLDATFNPGAAVGGTDPVVYSVAVQSNGQVVIAGQFTSVKGNHVAA